MTERSELTIAGHVFTVADRYAEGHVLTAGEASALNQTFRENIRNNFAKKVKDADIEEGGDVTELQSEVDTYADSYQFGVRTAGVRVSADPVRREAMNLAKAAIRAALKAQNKTAEADAIAAAADKLLDSEKGAKYLELARERVEQQRAIAGESLADIVSEIPDAPEKEETEAAAA